MEDDPRPVALVAGATGLVGRHLVEELRSRRTPHGGPVYREVALLVRRKSGVDPSGDVPVREIIQRLSRMHWVKEQLVADHVFCTLGTTIKKARSHTRFREIDHDYPVTLARITLENGARHFGMVSSIGASPTARSFYLRTKGEAEEAIRAVGFPSTAIYRPSVIGGKRGEIRVGEIVGKAILSVMPGRMRTIHARDIAAAMVTRALEEQSGLRILASHQIRRMARGS